MDPTYRSGCPTHNKEDVHAVTLWDWIVTLLLVALEFAVLAVIVAPHWVARQTRKLLRRLLDPFTRLSPQHADRQTIQTAREAR